MAITRIIKYLLILLFLTAFSTSAEELVQADYSYIDNFYPGLAFKNKELVQEKINDGKTFLEDNNMIVNSVKSVTFFNNPTDKERIYIKIVYVVGVKNKE